MNDGHSVAAPSFWLDEMSASLVPRAPLDGDITSDVAIVGAGFTGLWTAYYLLANEPTCRVVLLDAHVAGYGASGRNGGFCDAIIHGLRALVERDREGAVELWRAMIEAVDEVGNVARAQELDFGYSKGGCLQIAGLQLHQGSLKRDMEELHALGFDDQDYRWLEPGEVQDRANLGGLPPAFFTPHAAAVQPAKVARQLATAIEGMGAKLYEQTAAMAIERGSVRTELGTISAPFVVNATEAYGITLRDNRRSVLPLYNYMLATEPLAASVWDEIGMHDRVTVADGFRDLIYMQRTADDRITIGGRGSRYRYGSTIARRYEHDQRIFRWLSAELKRLFPSVDARITHRWGGVFGVPRDMTPSVGLDRDTGLAWAGGYVGSGVAAANLAGRTLADLMLDRDTERTRYPWVRPPCPSWEPEPLRWVGVQTMLRLVHLADCSDRRAPAVARALDRLIAWVSPGWEIG